MLRKMSKNIASPTQKVNNLDVNILGTPKQHNCNGNNI